MRFFKLFLLKIYCITKITIDFYVEMEYYQRKEKIGYIKLLISRLLDAGDIIMNEKGGKKSVSF